MQAFLDEVVGVAQVHFGEIGKVEVWCGPEGSSVEGGDVEEAVFDEQGGVTVGVVMVKVAVVGEDGFLDGFGPCGKTFEVMVAIALDVLDAESGHDCEILEECDRTNVGKVFPR